MIEVTSRRPTRRGERAWFKCKDCGSYGDVTGSLATVADVLRLLIDQHECPAANGAIS